MTKLLEEAIDLLRQLPPSMQDSAARAVLTQLDEELQLGDMTAGRNELEIGESTAVHQRRDETGSGH